MQEAFGSSVPIEAFAGCKRDIGQDREGCGAVALLDVRSGPFATLDTVKEVARSLLVEIAVRRLDDLWFPPGLRVLERAAAFGDDLVAIVVGVDGPEGAPELELGAARQDGLAVCLVD